ncbi:hypothetical protein [Salibacterium aidingense]|uniref:hypothetical protein n=1 Tax=Salibacterium aidingense TaxID=384933 RepID=UPI003BD1B793
MAPESPIELEALEVYLQPSLVSQREWETLYKIITKYLRTVGKEDMVRYPEKATVIRKIEEWHIHIQIKRTFTTDVILLYSDLSSFLNQSEALILLGVSNEHGRISTPLIIDLIVLIQTNIPGIIRVKGYLHPGDWGAAILRLQRKGLLSKK